MQLINMILWLLTVGSDVNSSEARLKGAFQSKRKMYCVIMVLYDDDDDLNIKLTLKLLSARKQDHVKVRVLMLL